MATRNNGDISQNNTLRPRDRDVALAGFAILELLLISLEERRVLGKDEIHGLLTDAAEAHREQAKTSTDGSSHLRVARLIERFRQGGNGTKPLKWAR